MEFGKNKNVCIWTIIKCILTISIVWETMQWKCERLRKDMKITTEMKVILNVHRVIKWDER